MIIKKNKQKHTPVSYFADLDWNKTAKLFQNSPQHITAQGNILAVRDVLRVIASAGLIGFVFAFPMATLALAPFVSRKQHYKRWQIRRVIHRLKQQQWVTVKENDNGAMTVCITKRGMQRALTYHLDTMTLRTQKHWDGLWRVVIFDIPEKYKGFREIFRVRIKQLGLCLLQESVYVSPYPCFDEIEFLRQLYKIPFQVRYIVAKKIEDDHELRIHFGLSD